MNTTDNNKLLAEFMGKEWHNSFFAGVSIISPSNITYKFHTDYNWLMQVVDKIETIKKDNLYFNIQIDKDKVSLFYTHISEPTKQTEMFFEWGQENKIANIYKIVVEFVKWYNQTK